MAQYSLVTFTFMAALLGQQHAAFAADAFGAPRPPSVTPTETYVFTAPPREGNSQGADIYSPIAEYLTQTTGKTFTYRKPDNWLTYTDQMRKGAYDVVFDGPHFVGWRTLKLDHTPLLKLPQPHVWVVIARAGDEKIVGVKNLVGRKVCAHAPPNFGTLTLQSLFDNPLRQPYIVEIQGWDAAYNGVIGAKCDGAIVPVTNWKKLDPDGKTTKVIHQHKPYPNQAFTVGPRISSELRARILHALDSPKGKEVTRPLRERFARGADLIAATREEYADVALVLKDYYGFAF